VAALGVGLPFTSLQQTAILEIYYQFQGHYYSSEHDAITKGV
jgi:hypothetical protein